MIVSLLQPVVSDTPSENLKQVCDMICHTANLDHTDLVILPELWNTPFINEDILKHQDEWEYYIPALRILARFFSIWIIAGTLPRKDEEQLYNSCAIINDQGEIVETADKTHLLEVHTRKNTYRESDVFTPGDVLKTIQTPWGRIGILICFDNRFPETARAIAHDCFMIAAPCGFNDKVGPLHWDALFKTRSMENEVFYCAVNPARAEYSTYSSYGHSLITGPDGRILKQLDDKPGILTLEIDPDQVEKIRTRSPFWNLRRPELY
ncbi:MAG: nitrilase-related carbon-nitrogen hydrolase [Allobaculum sp.]